MIRMQMGEDHGGWGEPVSAEKTADHAVVFPGIHDDNIILIPEDGGIGVSDAELDILRFPVRRGDQRNADNRQAGEETEDPNPRLRAEQAAERNKNGQHAQNREPG